MRRRSALVALAMLFFAGTAAAQEVYGRVWVAGSGGATPAGGATVTVNCDSAASKKADKNGSYSVNTAGSGDCAVQVAHRGRTSSPILVHVSGARTRANLELRSSGKGWSLVRK